MPAIWFIGDTHFGHEKVASIRGFDETWKHDSAIMQRWHKQVGAEDLVYVLGDISGGSRTGEGRALECLESLPGRKVLICGNHDSVSSIHRKASPHVMWFRSVFERIQDFARIRIEGENVLLSHYPYASHADGPGRGEARYTQYRLPDEGLRLIHAHTHHTDPFNGSPTRREACVSWDAWGRLVNLGDIAQWIKEQL